MLTAATIDDFLGCFTIRQGSDRLFKFEPGYCVVIGTPGDDGTLRCNRDGTVSVSFYCPQGYRIGPDSPDARFSLDERSGTLQFAEPVSLLRTATAETRRYQISLFTDPGTGQRFTYGVIVVGDPEDVGAWGADDTTNSLLGSR